MHSTSILLTLGSLAGLAFTAPTAHQAARCGTKVFPSIMQRFEEASPNTVFPNSVTSTYGGEFLVSQHANNTNRILQGAVFSDIPAGAFGCQLEFELAPGGPTFQSEHAAINVTTLVRGHSELLVEGNGLTFNGIFADAVQDRGLFGTFGPLKEGVKVVINSQSCPTDLNGGGNLGFLFAIASNIKTPETLNVDQGIVAGHVNGLSLTFNC